MSDPGPIKLLYTAANEGEAQLLVDYLATFHIRGSVQGGLLSLTGGEVPHTQQTHPQVWVFDSDYDDALQVLEAWIAEDARTERGDDWTCLSCGEMIEGVFDQCWNCQATRPTDEPPTQESDE